MKSGKNASNKPSEEQIKYAEKFGKFSSSVFRTHFSWTKRNCGNHFELKQKILIKY